MKRLSVSQRITAAILGRDRAGNRRTAVAQQRQLPLARRLLTSVLSTQVRPPEPHRPVREQPHGIATAPLAGQRQGPPIAEPHTPDSPPQVRTDERLASEDSDAFQHGSVSHQRQQSTDEKPSPASGRDRRVPQHLSSEDRQDYEQILDEALRSAAHHPELAAVGQRLNPEQLRTMALNATALITTAAASEYQHYVEVREELRQLAPSISTVRDTSNLPLPDVPAGRATSSMGEATEPAGAGGIAVVALLTPVLTGTAAAIFLLVGYMLKMLDPQPGIARTLLTTGWIFGAVTAASMLVAVICLLLAALRSGSSPSQADPHSERSKEVVRAKEAWHSALIEHGIIPFIREALADPSTAVLTLTKPSEPTSRIPQLGYNRPGFSSPDGGPATGPRPSYSTPDFSSPDFGGPAESTPPTRSEQAD